MVSYYFREQAGEGGGGRTYCPRWSAETREAYFSKMDRYPGSPGDDPSILPARMYFFSLDAREREEGAGAVRCSVIGNTAPRNGFVHQYLLDGAEHEKIMQGPDWIFRVRPHFTDPAEVFSGAADKNGQPVLRPDVDVSGRIWTGARSDYTLRELMEEFSLTEEDLRRLLWSFFRRGKRTYLLLPSDDLRGTELALSLMRRVLRCMPPSVMEKTGFVTFSPDPGEELLPEITHVFVAGTPENREKLEREPGYLCSLQVPAVLTKLVDELRACAGSGHPSPELSRCFRLLERLPRETAGELSDEQLSCLLDLAAEMVSLETGAKSVIPEERVWACAEALRACLRDDDFRGEMESFLRKFMAEGRAFSGNAEQMARMYELLPGLQGDLADFFAGSVDDAESLRGCLDFLGSHPSLQRQVKERLYRQERWQRSAVELEKRSLYPDPQKTLGPVEGVRHLTGRLRELAGLYEPLIREPEILECAGAVLEMLFLGGGERNLQEDREAMQDYVAACSLIGLPQEYLAAAADVFDRYLQQEEAHILETYSDPSGMASWPPVLCSVSAGVKARVRRLSDSLDEKADDFHRAEEVSQMAQNAPLPRIRNYLADPGNRENFEALRKDPVRRREVLESILQMTRDYGKSRGRADEREKLFDSVNALLYQLFPQEQEDVLRSVMEAPLGGIPSMSKVYRQLRASGADMDVLQEQMQTAIRAYYRTHRAGFWEKRSIRQEEAFLERIGLRPDSILG